MWHIKMFKNHKHVGSMSFENKYEAEKWMDFQGSQGIFCSLDDKEDDCPCPECVPLSPKI